MIKGEIIAQILGDWASEYNVYSMILRVALSMLFAFCLGTERSINGHTAGIKTFILMSVTSTIATLVDIYLITWLNISIPLCSGIAVLASALIGGNVILYNSKNQIKGITTSSWLLTSSVLGVLVGIGLYTISVIILVCFMLIILFMPKLEVFLKNRATHFEIHVELKDKKELPNFLSVIRQLGIEVDETELDTAFVNTGISAYSIKLKIIDKKLKEQKQHKDIITALRQIDSVFYIEERN